MESVKLSALSDGMRKMSYNSAAINALQKLAPGHVEITIGDISHLPIFNPDREDENIPGLGRLKHSLSQSSGLAIASPEYAHSISGPL